MTSTYLAAGSGASTATLILVAVIAVAGVLTTAVIQWWVGKRTSKALSESADAAKSNAEAAQMSAEAASRSSKAAVENVDVTRVNSVMVARRAEEDAFAYRYHEASAQLGHENPFVRIAGVHAMARLAENWSTQQANCVEVLCAYLRMPWQAGPGDVDRADQEVRSTVLAIIMDHFRQGEWKSSHLDLRRATVRDADISRHNFVTAPWLRNTTFLGESFVGAFTTNITADFTNIVVNDGRLTFMCPPCPRGIQVDMSKGAILESGVLDIRFFNRAIDDFRLNLSGLRVRGKLRLSIPELTLSSELDLSDLELESSALVQVVAVAQVSSSGARRFYPQGQLSSWIIASGSKVEIDPILAEIPGWQM